MCIRDSIKADQSVVQDAGRLRRGQKLGNSQAQGEPDLVAGSGAVAAAGMGDGVTRLLQADLQLPVQL